MGGDVRYRAMRPGEAAAVSALILSSFDEFIGPDLGDEGIAEFRKFAAPGAIEARAAEDTSSAWRPSRAPWPA